jgi:hypothetical protein
MPAVPDQHGLHRPALKKERERKKEKKEKKKNIPSNPPMWKLYMEWILNSRNAHVKQWFHTNITLK